ncbi:glycosyltransferase [Pseudotenacibaculum sp. MALMAid0570]|uniref:glycosyltransferase n=1 Tax=Pseudotenacibaculum sp. MALMAid0570 TaxID=3143938 RepID=UPI0032DF6E9C
MKKVIVAPLDWGLGHASRCVPIIKALLQNQFSPVIASDGKALAFLRKEFPDLEVLKLPSYNVTYKKNLKWSLFKKIPSLLKTAKEERKIINRYVNENSNAVGIISDNRFGVYSSKIPSVYITHQLNVLSGIFTPITSCFHQRIIKRFDECWIPDEEGSLYSGRLSKSKRKLNQKYIGILSRFQKREVENTIDILIVLSGPEPNRSELELLLKQSFQDSEKSVVLVKGVVEEDQKEEMYRGIRVLNYMLSDELEKALNTASLVICRSGYSSIMDLVRLDKKALLIPTENQNEQEFLAEYVKEKEFFSSINEKDFSIEALDFTKEFKNKTETGRDLDSRLFRLFQSK